MHVVPPSFFSPGPIPGLGDSRRGGERRLCDGVQPAPLDGTIAQRPPDRLVEVGGGGPADVAAAGAFARVVARRGGLGGPQLPAREALDGELFHGRSFGLRLRSDYPRITRTSEPRSSRRRRAARPRCRA